jgi:O-antigen/teichoic acid export membrane protein
MGVKGALCANALSNGLWAAVLVGIVLRRIPWRINRDKLERMLHYGIPTVAWSIAGLVLTFSDRMFLRYYGSLSDVGVYALGYKLAGVVSILVIAPFSMAWQWQQFELAKRENARSIFSKVETYALLVATFVGLGISVMARDVLRIMTPPPFWPAAHVVPLIALSYTLFTVQYVVITGIYVHHTTSRLAVIAAITAGANLALNYFATVLSYALQLTLCFLAAQQIYRVQYEYRRNVLILGGATAVYLLSTLPNLRIVASVMVNLSLLAAFLAFFYILMEARERQAILQWAVTATHEVRRGWVHARQWAASRS